ncbi:MAG: MATE family efflux transporter [Martelella sp.]|uniref:MATE family efflux transporter n=1 Tax=unclassified Martelella TaxID=2629616 RepID=UPI000C66E48A|nr:MATE family efflux transporter [Martelella sp.]MAU19621.1 MATE family efflux transporter [Martelella sp.]
MSDVVSPRANPYLSGPVWPLFLKTAAPIVLLMLVSGLYTVVDAIFLGLLVGPRALAAVTLVFPIFMAVAALSTLVSSGMASILARRLGAGDDDGAQAVLQSAMMLSLLVAVLLMAFYLTLGIRLVDWFSEGDAALAAMAKTYLAFVIFGSPLQFVISIQGDALRSEGKPGVMAGIGVLVTLANIGFNYVLIAGLGWGVAGSAIGTLAAQAVAMGVVVWLRLSGRTPLALARRTGHRLTEAWPRILALGLPPSLGLAGTSLSAGCYIIGIGIWSGDNHDVAIAAYGIASRLLTFAFLPLLGLNFACQSIVGNNFGAHLFGRSDRTLLVGLATGLCYGIAVELAFIFGARPIASLFVTDPAVIAEAVHIVRIVTAAYVLVAPLMVLAGYFQALGMASRAAAITLGRTYVFTLPLIFILPFIFGETGLWMAAPISDLGMMAIAITVLWLNRRGARLGLFYGNRETVIAVEAA